jgi:hypothetical protein
MYLWRIIYNRIRQSKGKSLILGILQLRITEVFDVLKQRNGKTMVINNYHSNISIKKNECS